MGESIYVHLDVTICEDLLHSITIKVKVRLWMGIYPVTNIHIKSCYVWRLATRQGSQLNISGVRMLCPAVEKLIAPLTATHGFSFN
jgi:hypothetical protein